MSMKVSSKMSSRMSSKKSDVLEKFFEDKFFEDFEDSGNPVSQLVPKVLTVSGNEKCTPPPNWISM